MDAAAGQTFARSGRLNGPNAPTKRKSSNILGSLGRAATISDRHDKSKDGANGTEGPSDVAMYSGLPPASATSFDAPASPALSTATSQQQYFSSQAGANPSQSLSTALDSLKQAMAKRLETWKYLKSVHQGQQTLWFHTIALTRADLEHHLNQGRSNAAGANLQKRTLRFMLLGLNLSPIMDMPSSTEFLKALSLLTQDFDQLSDDTLSRTRMRSIFRPASRITRARSNTVGGPPHDGFAPTDDPASSLFCPNIPFELDYFQTFFTLADTLVELYGKILATLNGGVVPLPKSGSVSGQPNQTPMTLSVPSTSSSIPPNYSSQSALAPGVLDMLTKIDNRLKKIINTVIKELDAVARQSIREELAGLDAALGGNLASQPPELVRRATGLED